PSHRARALVLAYREATQCVGVDAARPEPEIDALPKKLGVHGEHLSRLGPGYNQITPGCRAALVLRYHGPLPPGVQTLHVVEEVMEERWSCRPRLAHRVVVIIDDEKGVVHLASGPPLNTHCHSHSLFEHHQNNAFPHANLARHLRCACALTHACALEKGGDDLLEQDILV